MNVMFMKLFRHSNFSQ